MNRDELDIIWCRARHDAIKAGEYRTRYHFAALLHDRMISEGWRQCAQGQRTSQHCAVAERATVAARNIERKRCAALAEQHGHQELAAIIRSHACPDCHGIGYDASGQVCACQENPSF